MNAWVTIMDVWVAERTRIYEALERPVEIRVIVPGSPTISTDQILQGGFEMQQRATLSEETLTKLKKDMSDSVVAIYTNEGAHCLDLRNPSPSDPDWLVAQKEMKIILNFGLAE
ncbi:hypothetical protein JRO89_XSUnG0092400 [Xanthoceras sorbifolium]|uniref:Uncharacterized protein n=1 Tax=Xanthoceras sorbifolium TaxID=99658 RepID=A0ABQ8GYT5_9ROSI|nr:hypothetical protein JRO89_XSUnG0092400 [Xanthoceras sorbifolium]